VTVNRDEFARLAQDFISAELPAIEITYETDKYRLLLKYPDGLHHFVFLGYALSEYNKATPLNKQRALRRRLWTLLPTHKDIPKDRIFKQLRPRFFERQTLALFDYRRRLYAKLDPEITAELKPDHRPYNAELAVGLVFELSEQAADVTADRRSRWGESFEILLDVAMKNLEVEGNPNRFEKLREGLYVSNTGDDYDAARLLMPDFISGLELKGEPIVMLPLAATLLVADSQNDTALMTAADLTLQAGQTSQGLSGFALSKTANGWETWMPSPDRRSYEKLLLARLQSKARAYQEQQHLLENLYQLEGNKDAIGPYAVLRGDENEVLTASLWAQGTVALLPKVDLIELVWPAPPGQEEPRTWPIKWDQLTKLLGDRMTLTEEIPERWRVHQFPTDDELLKLTELEDARP
jgi:hypothetical protein